MGKRFEREYEINYYDVDVKLKCKIEAIMEFFMDVGSKQSEILGVGLSYLEERKLAWVFCKYEIIVNRYPKYGERIIVATYPKSFRKFYASREYEIFDENGEKIIEARAVFLLIDTEKRKAIRIPEEQFELYGVNEEDLNKINVSKLEKLQDEMYLKQFKVRYSDIDSNYHVNNVKYVEWALEAIPIEILYKYDLIEIQVMFEKECSYGEEIRSICEIREENEGYKILHRIENIEGKELTILLSRWEKTKKD